MRSILPLWVLLVSLRPLFAQPIPSPWQEVPRSHGEAATQRQPLLNETVQHPRAREINFKALNYGLDLTINPSSGELSGVLEFTFAPLSASLSKLSLDAYALQVKEVVFQANGEHLSFTNNGRLLTIEIPYDLVAEEAYTVAISYSARPRENLFYEGPDSVNPHRMPAAYTYSEPEGSQHWFPCVDLPSAKATFTVSVTVPQPYKVLSNGKLVSKDSSKTSNYFSYRMAEPMAPYLLSLAIGDFSEYSLGSFHDIPLTLWTPPLLKDAALFETKDTRAMMQYFSELTGTLYPFSSYSQSVAQAWQTSMEHQTATTMGGYRISGDGTGEDVVAHELAHQWFGDWVTCKNWGELWLNEGFASYFPMRYLEAAGKHNSALSYEDSWRIWYFVEASQHAHPLSAPTVNMKDMFDSHAYQKGALMVKFLRSLLQNEEEFTKVMHYYLRRNGGGNVTSEALQEAFEKVTGRSWQQFFDQWIRSAGHPVLSADWQQQAEGLTLILTQQQALNSAKSWITFAFPLTIELLGTKGERQLVTADVHDTHQAFKFTVPFTVAAINLDPEWLIPMEWNLATPGSLFNNFKVVLRSSPSEKSRLYAMRKILSAQVPAHAKELLPLLEHDASLYLQADALSQLSSNKENASLVAQLLRTMKSKASDPSYDLPIKNSVAAAETWLVIHGEGTNDRASETEWQEAYLASSLTGERKALLDRLAFASLPRAQEFALARLNETKWVTRDRQKLIDILTTKPGPISHEFIVASLKHSAPHWFSHIVSNLLGARYEHPDLAPILIEQLENSRYSGGRIAAAQLLALQQESKDVVCKQLPRIRNRVLATQPLEAEVLIAINHALSTLSCTL